MIDIVIFVAKKKYIKMKVQTDNIGEHQEEPA